MAWDCGCGFFLLSNMNVQFLPNGWWLCCMGRYLCYNVRPPSDVCWFRFAPVTIVISTINHSYWNYLHQLRYRTGASHCSYSYHVLTYPKLPSSIILDVPVVFASVHLFVPSIPFFFSGSSFPHHNFAIRGRLDPSFRRTLNSFFCVLGSDFTILDEKVAQAGWPISMWKPTGSLGLILYISSRAKKPENVKKLR